MTDRPRNEKSSSDATYGGAKDKDFDALKDLSSEPGYSPKDEQVKGGRKSGEGQKDF